MPPDLLMNPRSDEEKGDTLLTKEPSSEGKIDTTEKRFTKNSYKTDIMLS